MSKSLLLLLALFSILVACNKTPDPQSDVTTNLRTGKWKIASGTVTMRAPNGVKADQPYYPYLRKTCMQDDYIIFDSANHGAVYSNSTHCSVADADSISFVWHLKNNDKNIDLFNVYWMIDSISQQIALNSSSIYVATYSNATSHEANIRDGKLSNVTASSFTLEYSLIGQYLDTTGNPASPVAKPDTFEFHVNYTH